MSTTRQFDCDSGKPEDTQGAFGECQQLRHELSGLLEGSRAILAHREFKDAARAIFDSCKKLIKATTGYVAMKNEDGTENTLLFLDSGGQTCAVDPSPSMPIRGMRERAYRSGQVEHDNDFAESEHAGLLPEGHARLDNVLFAPLMLDGEAMGLLGLANKPGGFTDNDLRLAASFAELAAIALENSRLLESQRQARADLEAQVQQRTAELTRANKTLQEREERHACVLEAIGQANIGLLLVDPEHQVRLMNQPMVAAFGDQTGRVCYEGISKASAPCAYCRLEEVVREHKCVRYRPTTASGAVYDIVAVPLRDVDGTTCKLEILQDVTEKVRADAALRESRIRTQLLADVLERSSLPFGVGYPDGHLGFFNPAFCKLTGYSETELARSIGP